MPVIVERTPIDLDRPPRVVVKSDFKIPVDAHHAPTRVFDKKVRSNEGYATGYHKKVKIHSTREVAKYLRNTIF